MRGISSCLDHHVYAGKPETLDSTLWLGGVRGSLPSGGKPVACAYQRLDSPVPVDRSASRPAPFLPCPPLLP